ncbi:MAG: GPR endopeptidase [Clostridia bacterium]|nr:GPR endopeptidase [Clostridia bacterium]
MENKRYGRVGRFNSDLAMERRRADVLCPGIEYKKDEEIVGHWERIRVMSEDAEREIGRPKGSYDTLTLPPMGELDSVDIEDAEDAVSRELCKLCEKNRISPHRVLVIGLGNSELTPDAVGPRAASRIEPTMHIAKTDKEMFDALSCSEVAVIVPGVRGQGGIETADVVGGLAERICPSLVIAIDSLAARSPKRLGTTIQFCDTGIHPGSGVGSHERAIDEDLMGAPVISIGVPTVIDSKLLVEGEGEAPTSGMLVCPKDIDETVNVAAKIISGGINQAFGILR